MDHTRRYVQASRKADVALTQIAACSVVGGLIAIGLILWLIMRHRKSKKSDYSPDQDEIRWPEASEPADLFPAAATRTGGHGLGRDNSMRSMASRSEGFGAVESSHRPYSDQSFGGHGQQQFMSDNGHGMMSYADHSSYDPQTPNAAGVGAGGFAAPAGAAGAMPYHPGGGTSEYHYPPGSSSENGFFNYQGAGAGQQPQQYEAPRHMSYYGSESHADMHGVGSGGEYADYADYQTAYGGSNSADGLAPHGQEHEGRQERLANPYDGLDDDTGSVRNSHSGGGRLGVVNL